MLCWPLLVKPSVRCGIDLSRNNTDVLFVEQGETSEATTLFKRTREMLEKSLGRDHPNVAAILNNQAVMLNNQVGADTNISGNALRRPFDKVY